jgi:hypothetical protein
MWLCDLLYDQTCNVWSESYVRSRWSDVVNKNVKYTGIPCTYEDSIQKVNRQAGLAREVDVDEYYVYLPILYKDVLKWDIIQIFDQAGNSVWEYIIDAADVFGFSTWPTDVDNVFLKVSNR